MEYPEHLSAEAVAARLQLEQGLKPKDAEPQVHNSFDCCCGRSGTWL